MSENIKDVCASALGELGEFEAAAFRFGQQVRAFLADFPAGLPVPSSALPRFSGERFNAEGGVVFGSASYVHLIMRSEEEVGAWAEHLGTEVTRRPQDTGRVTISTEGALDGLTLYVGHSDVDRTGGESR